MRPEPIKALVGELCVEVVERLLLWRAVAGVLYGGRIAAVVGGVGPTGPVLTLRGPAGPLTAGLTHPLAGPHHAVARVTRVHRLVLEVSPGQVDLLKCGDIMTKIIVSPIIYYIFPIILMLFIKIKDF